MIQREFLAATRAGLREVRLPARLVLEGYGPEGQGKLLNDAIGWNFSHLGVLEDGGGAIEQAYVFVR